MSALQELALFLEQTPPMQKMLAVLREEPARLLGDVCRIYEARKTPVPDHDLQLNRLFAEAAAEILIAAGLLTKCQGGSLALFVFEPTPRGLEFHRKLAAEGFYRARHPAA